MNTIALVLTPGGAESQLIINGVDVSDACKAVSVYACVGEPTEVTVTLVGRVEILADVERVIIERHRTETLRDAKPGGEPTCR